MRAINNNREMVMCNGYSKSNLICPFNFKYGCKRAQDKLITTHYPRYFIELPLIKLTKDYECDYYIPVNSDNTD